MHQVTVFFTILFLGVLSAAPVQADDEHVTQQALAHSVLVNMSNTTSVPALSVAVIQNGILLWQDSVGFVDIASGHLAGENSRFRLASVSKAITATLMAKLVEEGLLDVDAPISNYLADLPPAYNEITVLQLITHTSGMPHYQPRDGDIADTHYSSAVASLQAVGERKLLSRPGTAYHYSTHGYTLLGAVYEAITGENFELALNSFRSDFTGRSTPVIEHTDEPREDRSKVYELGADGATLPPIRDQSYAWAGAGMEGSALDLAHWGQAVLHSSYLSKATRNMMFTPFQFADGSSPGTYMYSIAFGWRVGSDGFGRRVAHHAGVTQGARSILVVYPDDGVSIALLSNASWTAQIERTAFAFAQLFLSEAKATHLATDRRVQGEFAEDKLDARVVAGNGNGLAHAFADEGRQLSTWLNRFDPLDRQQNEWPFYKLKSSTGSSLLLVSTIGLISLVQLSSEDGVAEYAGKLGKSRTLKLTMRR